MTQFSAETVDGVLTVKQLKNNYHRLHNRDIKYSYEKKYGDMCLCACGGQTFSMPEKIITYENGRKLCCGMTPPGPPGDVVDWLIKRDRIDQSKTLRGTLIALYYAYKDNKRLKRK